MLTYLFCSIPRKQYARRNIAGMDFELGNGLKFSVGMFVLFSFIFDYFMIIYDAFAKMVTFQLLLTTLREDSSACDSKCRKK